MPCFILMEELEKLRLVALLWGQSGVVVSGEAGAMPSLQGCRAAPVPQPLALALSISSRLWQCFPVKCSGQTQCGPLGMFTQVPPPWQGLYSLQWSKRWTQWKEEWGA